jgi:hypothetical protein
MPLDACMHRELHVVLQAAAAAGTFRRGMHGKLVALEERALAAGRRRTAAATAAAACTGEVVARKEGVRQLLEMNEHLKAALMAEAEWARREIRTVLEGTPVGRVTWEVRCRLPVAAGCRPIAAGFQCRVLWHCMPPAVCAWRAGVRCK